MSSKQVSIAEARSNLSALIEESDEGPIELTRRGHPVAYLVSAGDYHRRRGLWTAIEQFREENYDDLPEENLFIAE